MKDIHRQAKTREYFWDNQIIPSSLDPIMQGEVNAEMMGIHDNLTGLSVFLSNQNRDLLKPYKENQLRE